MKYNNFNVNWNISTWLYVGVECMPLDCSRRFDWFFQYSFRIFGIIDASRAITWFGTSAAVAPLTAAAVSRIVGITNWIESVVEGSVLTAHSFLFWLLILRSPPSPFSTQWIADTTFPTYRIKSKLKETPIGKDQSRLFIYFASNRRYHCQSFLWNPRSLYIYSSHLCCRNIQLENSNKCCCYPDYIWGTNRFPISKMTLAHNAVVLC